MNGLRINFYDQELEFRVETFLKSRNFPSFKKLEVSVYEGVVTISGQLRSYYEKQVAISSCLRVAGVTTMVDQIEVRGAKPK